MYRRLILLILLLCAAAAAASTFRLYLKDGSWHVVREYQKLADRVRYYSTERGDWEEIPLALADLERTEKEVREREESRKADVAAFDAEEKLEREQRREIERIPYEPGAFQVEGEELKALKQAEAKTVSNKRRSILKAITPVPLVAGKQTVEIDGTRSAYVVSNNRPEFYFRLAAEERFGILKAKPGKNTRIVQTWNVAPVTNEVFEEFEQVEVFKKQLAEGLYKIWPTKPLVPGEYAVFEYTEGKANIQVWDFTVPGNSKSSNN